MTLILDNAQMVKEEKGVSANEELTLRVKTVNVHTSPMSDDHKRKPRENAPSLKKIFHETVKNKGELSNVKVTEDTDGAYEVRGLSNLTLHAFILEAEKLGKKVTYKRTLEVSITE